VMVPVVNESAIANEGVIRHATERRRIGAIGFISRSSPWRVGPGILTRSVAGIDKAGSTSTPNGS